MMRIISLFCVSLLLIQCKGDNVSQVIEESQAQIEAKTISKKDIEAIRYTEFNRSKDSEKAVSDWQKFQELNLQITVLKKGDLSFFNGERMLLKTFLLELKTEMPKALQTNEILARLTALDTKAQKLNSLLRLDNISKAEKLEAIKELLIAESNLNLQMNKKFEFEKNNILKPE